MNKFESVVRQALAANGAVTDQQRAEIFQRLHSGLENITATREQDYRLFMRNQLSEAIEVVKAEYPETVRPFEPDVFTMSSPDAALAATNTETSFVAVDPAAENHVRPEPMPAPDSPVSKNQNRTRWIIALVSLGVLALLAIFASSSFFGSSDETASDRLSFSIDLSKWEDQFSANHSKYVGVNSKSEVGTVIDSNGKSVLNLTGNTSLYSKDSFPIDPGKKYELAIALRSMPRSDGTHLRTITLAGLATFDKNGKLQTSVPGTHRYGLISKPVFSKDNWKVYRTTFTGTEAQIDSFRPGTVSARLALLLNLNKGAPRTTQIEWITFKELP